ncbi:MAG TPA: dolichol-phosphate mannosyltransferase [Elusimicrobia bacterium]|nr:dolichol-phosphate mannosyltransferase [Elusimicrobiota bacterium]HBT62189.1 dolichol-phosphate mannosyltransferase [Elusimicrobiota bacterium]
MSSPGLDGRERLSVSVVVPTYNERDNIGPLLRQLDRALAGRQRDFIVVDDLSPDGTGDAVRELAREIANVRLVTKARKEGIGAALRCGYDLARHEVIASTDADLSFSPADMPRLLERIEAGADLALGCRHMRGGGYETPSWRTWLKFAVSRLGNRLVRRATGLDIRDYSANFRAIRRAVWAAIETRDNTNSLLLEMILKVRKRGFRIDEVPVSFADRVRGESKLNLWIEAPKFAFKLLRHLGRR